MDTDPIEQAAAHYALHAPRNARNGLILFAIYVVLYGEIIGFNTFTPELMGKDVSGINFAIVYGMFLIVAAFVLAMIYAYTCERFVSQGGGK